MHIIFLNININIYFKFQNWKYFQNNSSNKSRLIIKMVDEKSNQSFNIGKIWKLKPVWSITSECEPACHLCVGFLWQGGMHEPVGRQGEFLIAMYRPSYVLRYCEHQYWHNAPSTYEYDSRPPLCIPLCHNHVIHICGFTVCVYICNSWLNFESPFEHLDSKIAG